MHVELAMITTESPTRTFIAPAVLAGALATGCVSAGAYDAKVDELEQSRAAAAFVDREQRARIAELERDLADLRQGAEATRTEAVRALADLTIAKQNLQRAHDDAIALAGALESKLASTGQNVARLVSEKGALRGALEDTKKRFDELRQQKAASEERAAVFRNLAKKLHRMIDAGELDIRVHSGRMLLVLPSDVLFDSGKTEIKDSARNMLAELGKELAALPDRRFEIGGHTDAVPIHTSRFPSNWELSAGRAIEVVKVMIDQGVRPDRISAAGYGEYDPISDRHADNRRIEISVLPNLEELPPVDDLL